MAKRQVINVEADKHHGDNKLNHIPDLREDWGNGECWQLYHRAYRVLAEPKDIPEVKLHGTYVVFATYDPRYEKSTHKVPKEQGKHVRKDYFIAKIGRYRDGVYDDVPVDFLSTRTKDGHRLWECGLAYISNLMVGLLQTW